MEDNGNKNVTDKWWNAALYNHDTGKPYAAFYELKNFTTGSDGINTVKASSQTDNCWYTLDGHKYNNKPTKKGIYINNKKKVLLP